MIERDDEMWKYNYTDELYHHGIKGMKWGVRRFQKKDGSLTSAGKKRYGDDNISSKPKSKHRAMLEEKYRFHGMSKEEAEVAAAKRIKTEKIVATAAALTLTAAAAYVVNKQLKIKADGVIKAGGSLQRIEMTDKGILHDSFYAAKDKADKTKYAGMLGKTRQAQVGKAYLMNIGVDSDIKIAGRDKAVKVFEDLYKNDSDFRKHASSMISRNWNDGNPAGSSYKKMYENFNSNFTDHNNEAIKKFYSALKAEGYGAVRDVNDMKFSGYKAKNPLIIFGGSGKVRVTDFREMSSSEIDKNLMRTGAKEAANSLAKITTAGLSYKTAKMYMDDHDKYKEPEEVKK